jgi:hypothetical protein
MYAELTTQNSQFTKAKSKWMVCFFAALLCVVCCELCFVQAAPPTTTPSSQIAAWFADLDNRDAAVREKARVNLMGISREDLKELRRIVEKSRPIAPSQAMALREIVEQVVQATESYPPLPGGVGFLGVTMPLPDIITVMQNPNDPQTPAGALVTDRLPGFCAYAALQNGDMIVGVAEAPDQMIRKSEDLTAIIGSHTAGEVVHLEILRNGKQLEVTLKLNARPMWAAPTSTKDIVEAAVEAREKIAHDYWEEHFAPLLGENVL